MKFSICSLHSPDCILLTVRRRAGEDFSPPERLLKLAEVFTGVTGWWRESLKELQDCAEHARTRQKHRAREKGTPLLPAEVWVPQSSTLRWREGWSEPKPERLFAGGKSFSAEGRLIWGVCGVVAVGHKKSFTLSGGPRGRREHRNSGGQRRERADHTVANQINLQILYVFQDALTTQALMGGGGYQLYTERHEYSQHG